MSGVQARVVATVALLAAGLAVPVRAGAAPGECNDPSCVPGIIGGVVLGAPCNDTVHFVFGTTSWGRLVFCGSPRRYAPRYFRSPPLQGVRAENSSCEGALNTVAQAPDGLFLSCIAVEGATRWVRGDV
ncbi:hypothetical protein Mycch_1608 [Mycolicibacterium chubuense NBB4]|uniref:Secreted protein n=1 Tax=Mycolicibacterium chubuense (strain NBB4) TaxID=710421 RepID=I4BGJ9_MYCCN|nr:hypothetical protein Mycch_1608 [Mycolicibacterium chubuense NBB4]